ncbi:D-alanyl-D-alanine carboxypeptidase [Oharaeibacter diazotrophicus]|uniref:D-alanyl-D-alanine carboxypeptidase n=3 Tax=Oharaeibacter diazotrophicus TaxID=1920512 RepID=A0A4R6RK47_9HYPH|nr:D-alanyl-D-alanine carboxypeptidase [Oharaeibacter diazotrophicus]TDP86475.1 D-alanyl-D-alanine carboxypeptidase [Oharaeibacter diazotrophicus]BBE71583.1 D-alanyl-D-alanine carboxypeptidase DacA precursor [Pleomorphomonas sp. SM30]GLS78344.1 penicillin-binding protein [Oharaeibacter diazotrophicus]
MQSWRARLGTAIKAAVAVVLAGGIAAGATGEARAAAPAGVYPDKYAAIVVDTATGKVLYEANADGRRYPASLTKMMTLYVLFEDLERGRFRLDSRLEVSRNASAQPPSKLGLRPGDTITVEEAIKGLVTKSANDAAATIGENLAGSVPAFADRMTRTARALGMSNTRFRNANGLPDPGQYTSARDMMKLGVALQVRFPTYYEFFKTRSFTFRGKVHGNHNRLLGAVDGVDGIKTGYINASGFNLVSSVKRDGRKIVAVVMGGRTARSRDAHMVRLIEAYLPLASRGRGYDDELVAAVRSAPKVAASAPHPVPEALQAAAPEAVEHPQPSPRPVQVAADGMPEIVTASVVPTAVPESAPQPVAAARQVRVEAIPVPVSEPVSLATAKLPSSAAEAFGDVAPLSSAERDALGSMIEQTIGEGDAEPIEVASVDSDIAAPTPRRTATARSVAPPAPAAVREEARAAARGWMIQIGAVPSKAAAADLIRRAQAKGGKALAAADPVTETVSKGGQTLVRARFAGFESEKAASRACAALKRSDMNCYSFRL